MCNVLLPDSRAMCAHTHTHMSRLERRQFTQPSFDPHSFFPQSSVPDACPSIGQRSGSACQPPAHTAPNTRPPSRHHCHFAGVFVLALMTDDSLPWRVCGSSIRHCADRISHMLAARTPSLAWPMPRAGSKQHPKTCDFHAGSNNFSHASR